MSAVVGATSPADFHTAAAVEAVKAVIPGWAAPLGSRLRRFWRLQPGAACPAPPPTPWSGGVTPS